MKPQRPDELDHRTAMPRDGLLFVGDKGKLLAGYYGGNPFRRTTGPFRGLDGGLLLPEEKYRDIQQPPKTLARCEQTDHYREWTQACKTGVPTVCPIEFGCQLTEMALLGALALCTGNGRVLEWDAPAMRVTNVNAANQYVDPPYRAGWQS